MMNRNTEEMMAGQYIIRWTSVLSNRFDTTAFKKVLPDVYKEYTKQTASRRFTISAWHTPRPKANRSDGPRPPQRASHPSSIAISGL